MNFKPGNDALMNTKEDTFGKYPKKEEASAEKELKCSEPPNSQKIQMRTFVPSLTRDSYEDVCHTCQTGVL